MQLYKKGSWISALPSLDSLYSISSLTMHTLPALLPITRPTPLPASLPDPLALAPKATTQILL